jgi:hypothetical protein
MGDVILKATSIVRKLEKLGRIAIPKEGIKRLIQRQILLY